MGTWGARIYEDDIALDVRHDFMTEYHNGTAVPTIEAMIREESIEGDNPDNDDVVILALCCAELETGTLTDETKKQALEVIESGRQYRLWLEEADKAEAGLRSRELTLIKKYVDNYEGKPIKRKSWVELQREDKEVSELSDESNDKLDDAGWHEPKGLDVDDDSYFEYAGAHIAAFTNWLVTRDYYNLRYPELSKLLDKAKSGKITPFQFFDQAMDQKFFSHDAKSEVRDFVAAYYTGGRDFYVYDYTQVVAKGRDLYSFLPTAEGYEAIARRIDQRLGEYRNKPYQPGEGASRKINQALAGAYLLGIISLGVFGFGCYLIFQSLHDMFGW